MDIRLLKTKEEREPLPREDVFSISSFTACDASNIALANGICLEEEWIGDIECW